MAKLRHGTISKRTVEAIEVEKDTVFWDRELTGFGMRAYASGAKVYVAQTPRAGRSEASDGRPPRGHFRGPGAQAGGADHRPRQGGRGARSPAPMAPRTGPTVAELAARYLEEHMAVHCKPGTTVRCRRVIRKYILPDFGEFHLAAVEREHVTEMHYKLCDVPAMANRAVATLSRMFNQAEAWGLAPEGSNPCRFLVKYKERRRERFLTEEEFRRLGRLLSEAAAEGGVSAQAAAAIRLLMLTGCRRNEILTLRWEDVDLDEGELPSAGRQDRAAGGSSVAGRREACCWPAARSRQSVGLSRQETGYLSNECRRSLASGEGARRAGWTCGFMICGTALRAGRWRSVRACR